MIRARRTTQILVAAVLALGAIGCAPPTGPAGTDTLDLGTIGTFSEPALRVEATVSEDYSPRGPRSSFLTVTAFDSGGQPVTTFVMREDNVSGAISVPHVGRFAGLFEPPHIRRFDVVRGTPGTTRTTVFGVVDISELEVGDAVGTANGTVAPVTRLRASVQLLGDGYGSVGGYLTIG